MARSRCAELRHKSYGRCAFSILGPSPRPRKTRSHRNAGPSILNEPRGARPNFEEGRAMGKTETKTSTCYGCAHTACFVKAHLEDGRLVKVTPDPEKICVDSCPRGF